jgi:hypothetical protein
VKKHQVSFDMFKLAVLILGRKTVSTSFHLWNWRDVIFRRWKGC